MDEYRLGLLMSVFDPCDLSAYVSSDELAEVDQHGRFFTVEMREMVSRHLVKMQFRQGMAPETAITILQQAIALLETHGRELLNQSQLGGGARLNTEDDIVRYADPEELDADEVIDHLPPESRFDPDWLDNAWDWYKESGDLDEPPEEEDHP